MADSGVTKFCGCKVGPKGEWLAPCALHREHFARLALRASAESARETGQTPALFEEPRQ